MKTVTIERYACEVCGETFKYKRSAEQAEAVPVRRIGVKVGESVVIKSGDGAGSLGKVTKVLVMGHECPMRYEHTEALQVDIQDARGGSRTCLYDEFVPLWKRK